MKPFIKWAGGKRWLLSHPDFKIPEFAGKYLEPFLGGGAVYFHLKPDVAILSDVNPKLIQAYLAIQQDWQKVLDELYVLQKKHSKSFYYEERARIRRTLHGKAAQFLYLNRTCFNGLYRENLRGEFNVPVGTKINVVIEDEDLFAIHNALSKAEIVACDFEETIDRALEGDLIFVDPPYTTAHNHNGFVKYNQQIFDWADQLRLHGAILRALAKGAKVVLTNADHQSIHDLYDNLGSMRKVARHSVMSGKPSSRTITTEAVYVLEG